MRAFIGNLALAFAWSGLAGELTLLTLTVGFAFGYLVLAWMGSSYVRRVPRVLLFVPFYLWEVIHGSVQIAWDVITPERKRRVGIIALPLDATTDVEIALLANLVTFTPGTIALDVTADRRHLLIHAMFIDDLEAFKARLKHRLERRVLEILR